MEARRERGPAVEPSADQQISSDRADRIRKLRWLGMQEEAERLHMTLLRVPHTDCVIVMPCGTE